MYELHRKTDNENELIGFFLNYDDAMLIANNLMKIDKNFPYYTDYFIKESNIFDIIDNMKWVYEFRYHNHNLETIKSKLRGEIND